MNRKGFTLIELLGVIVIIGLVIGGSIFGIIKLINSSKDEASIISESSIKKTASIYSTEKNDDENYWTEMTREGYEGKYFCVTIEELLNKGLLPKDKDLGGIDIHTYVGIRKDNITLVNGNPILLKNTPLNEENNSLTEEQIIYGVCTGNIIKETITKHPVLSGGKSYTDEIINISFTDIEGENIKIKESTCSYGLTSGNLDHNGTISGNTCNLDKLKDNTDYYVRVCTSTEGGSTACSDTISKLTKDIVEPSFNLSDKLKITYNNDNIKGDSYYYFKSSINATSNVNVSSCTLNNDNTFNCNNDNTTNINSNAWYKTTNKDIELTYNASGKVNIVARTYDKSNNYAESKKDFNVYKAIFKKGSVDKIGNGTTDITKICLAETSGTCSIKSPTIEKLGYNVVGWNTNANATTSSWNANTDKNNVNGTYYPIVKAKTIKVIFYRNASTSDSTTATQTFTYGVSGQAFSDKGWTNTGHTMAGWARSKTATTKDYNVLSGVNDTWINDNTPSIDLYAVWNKNTYTISYDANGGTEAPAAQTKYYGTDIELSETIPKKDCSQFLGWNTKKDGTGTTYKSKGIYKANKDITLYAKWQTANYKLEYDSNDFKILAKNMPSNQTTKGCQTIKVSSTVPTRRGFFFKGWSEISYGILLKDATIYKAGDIINITKDTTLYAQWESTDPIIECINDNIWRNTYGRVTVKVTDKGNDFTAIKYNKDFNKEPNEFTTTKNTITITDAVTNLIDVRAYDEYIDALGYGETIKWCETHFDNVSPYTPQVFNFTGETNVETENIIENCSSTLPPTSEEEQECTVTINQTNKNSYSQIRFVFYSNDKSGNGVTSGVSGVSKYEITEYSSSNSKYTHLCDIGQNCPNYYSPERKKEIVAIDAAGNRSKKVTVNFIWQ